jgi:hypothetical protein
MNMSASKKEKAIRIAAMASKRASGERLETSSSAVLPARDTPDGTAGAAGERDGALIAEDAAATLATGGTWNGDRHNGHGIAVPCTDSWTETHLWQCGHSKRIMGSSSLGETTPQFFRRFNAAVGFLVSRRGGKMTARL